MSGIHPGVDDRMDPENTLTLPGRGKNKKDARGGRQAGCRQASPKRRRDKRGGTHDVTGRTGECKRVVTQKVPSAFVVFGFKR